MVRFKLQALHQSIMRNVSAVDHHVRLTVMGENVEPTIAVALVDQDACMMRLATQKLGSVSQTILREKSNSKMKLSSSLMTSPMTLPYPLMAHAVK